MEESHRTLNPAFSIFGASRCGNISLLRKIGYTEIRFPELAAGMNLTSTCSAGGPFFLTPQPFDP